MTKPSWQDYGTYDESEHARLWDGVVGAWCPALGPTGSRLFDHSRFSNWGTLTNMDNATDWVVDGGQYALDFDGTDDHVAGIANIQVSLGMSIAVWFRAASTSKVRHSLYSGSADSNPDIYTHIEQVSGTTYAQNLYIATGYRGAGTSFSLDTQWHLYGYVLSNDGTTRYYRDGVANGVATTVSTSIGQDNSTGSIGAIPDLAFLGFTSQGQIAEVTRWNREILPNEWRDLYLLGRGGMYQRRRRSRRRAIEQAAGFKAYWVRQQSRVIGGGV